MPESVALDLTELRVEIDHLLLVDRVLQLTEIDDAAQRVRQLAPRLRRVEQTRLHPQGLEIAVIIGDQILRLELDVWGDGPGRHPSGRHRRFRHLVGLIARVVVVQTQLGGFRYCSLLKAVPGE